MKKTVKLATGFRKAISLGLVVIAAAASLTGCNGKIYSALFETKMLQYLPFLLGEAPVVLTEIQVSPLLESIPAGFSLQYHATGIYSNNTIVDLTEFVDWENDNTLFTTITDGVGGGLLSTTGGSASSVTITAFFEGQTGTATLNVTSATLDYLTITPTGDKSAIANGTSIQFSATGIFSDNSTLDLTEQVNWTTGNGTIMTISNTAGTRGVATGQSTGTTYAEANYSGTYSNQYSMEVTGATITSLTISPRDPIAYVISFGTTQQFSAIGTFTDLSTQDLTEQVDWSSSDTDIATIDEHGLAITVAAGNTVIGAVYPEGGDPLTDPHDSTTLSVRHITLVSLDVAPSTVTKNPDQTQQFTATGTYSDSTTQDLTTQVVWSTDDPAIATISNGAGTNGLATAVSSGSVTVTASRGGRTATATFNVNAADIDKPYITNVKLLPPLVIGTTRVRVTFSEPMDINSSTTPVHDAAAPSNYKILLTSAYTGVCDDNTNFTGTGGVIASSAVVESQTSFVLTFAGGTTVDSYYLIGHKTNLRDPAGNDLACDAGASNYKEFAGVDTIQPYMVSIINNEPLKIIVKFSEDMLNDGSATAADNYLRYTIEEDPSDGNDNNNVRISTQPADNTPENMEIDAQTYQLILEDANPADGYVATSVQSIRYKVTVDATVTDQAATPNAMGEPRFLTFIGNEQLKVVSAEANDTTHVKITFNKPVTTATCECNDSDPTGGYDCHVFYKLFPRNNSDVALLGNITQAVRGAGDEANTVVITHDVEQEGIAYSIAVANARDGDGFNNGTTSIQSVKTPTENVQAAPKDRASFLGKGESIDEVTDGGYYIDPFSDGSTFSWSFTYRGRVYLGTNDHNNGAFRFDPNGLNSVLVTFDFSSLTALDCESTTGFGYITPAASGITDNAWPQCGNTTYPNNSGPDSEVGVVGFNAIYPDLNNDGTPEPEYELLIAGPLKNNIDNIYYTQDADTELNWKYATVTGTNGLNSKSVQTIYGHNKYLFVGISSNANSIIPILNRYIISQSGGEVTLGTAAEVVRAAPWADPVDNTEVAGIDSIIVYNDYLYVANNGGVGVAPRSSWDQADSAGADITFSWTTATPSGATGSTLQLPFYNTTDGGGLGKISPGKKGYPIMREYNGLLYLARNVADTATSDTTPLRGEIWVCDPNLGNDSGDGDPLTDPARCEAADWTRIISGSETELQDDGSGTTVTAKQISLLQNLGDGWLYVGFDDISGAPTGTQNGIRLFKINSATPPATSGTMASAGWTKVGNTGFWHNPTDPPASYTNETYFDTFYSSTEISDGIYRYIYFTVGDYDGSTGNDAIQVYRERIEE
ncbi:MAG: Ig-like domain-containing protein [Bacteroidota bacterium]|nr:Ig-like domain-containing protein [Bacteroidota bacterium]